MSNHDHSRFLTRTNRTVGRIATKGAKAANENVEKCILREAVVMQMTWPGAPTVYYNTVTNTEFPKYAAIFAFCHAATKLSRFNDTGSA